MRVHGLAFNACLLVWEPVQWLQDAVSWPAEWCLHKSECFQKHVSQISKQDKYSAHSQDMVRLVWFPGYLDWECRKGIGNVEKGLGNTMACGRSQGNMQIA